MASPTRDTSESELDQWNIAMRQSPLYQSFIQRNGLTGKVGGWSREQQAAWEREMAQNGIQVPKGMHIDQGGNLNQKNSLKKNIGIGAAIGGAALTGFGLAGMGPLGGMLGLGGAAAGGAGAAGAAGAGAAGAGAGAAGAGASSLGLLSGGVLPLGTGLGGAAAAGGASAGGIGGILGSIGGAIKADPLGSLGKIGSGISGAASGMASGRRDDAYAQAAAGRVNQDAMQMDQKRAVLSSLLGGVQDASISRPVGSTIPTFGISGGLRPSALSGKDALMAELGRKAPTIDPAKAGMAENIMGGIGTGLGILGSFKPKVQMPVGYGGPL
jgi:hypothetical protein